MQQIHRPVGKPEIVDILALYENEPPKAPIPQSALNWLESLLPTRTTGQVKTHPIDLGFSG
jgi:hypothetical protein